MFNMVQSGIPALQGGEDVKAGMARSGSVYDLTMTPELLERAFKNTVELLKGEVVVDPEGMY
jgi:hypothetical protein